MGCFRKYRPYTEVQRITTITNATHQAKTSRALKKKLVFTLALRCQMRGQERSECGRWRKNIRRRKIVVCDVTKSGVAGRSRHGEGRDIL